MGKKVKQAKKPVSAKEEAAEVSKEVAPREESASVA